MKHLLRSFIYLLVFSSAVVAQQVFTPAEIREDMKFLKNRFEQMHPGMYYYTDSVAYNAVYQQLYDGVDNNMTYQQMFQYISPLVTMVQDGHTSYKFGKKKYGKNPKLFPFYLQPLGGEYFVAYNGSADTVLVRGTKLLSINDEPLPTIITNLQSTYGTDDGNPSSKNYYASRLFNIFHYKFYGPSDSLKVTYQLPDSVGTETNYIKSETRDEIIKRVVKRYDNVIRKNFDYAILDSLKQVAKLDITTFSQKGSFLDIPQFKFKRLLKKRFRQIKDDGIQHLIVDLRGNGGGFIPNISRLMQYFAKEPFALSDTVFFKKAAFNKVAPFYTVLGPAITRALYKTYDDTYFYRKPKRTKLYGPVEKYGYKNAVYFLMDGGSYSATTFTMALAYDMGIGTFIGQPPGGANWGSFAMSWNDFKLPNSKISVHMPLYKLLHTLPNKRARSFVLTPDYEVEVETEDFLQRKDAVLDFTLDLIR